MRFSLSPRASFLALAFVAALALPQAAAAQTANLNVQLVEEFASGNPLHHGFVSIFVIQPVSGLIDSVMVMLSCGGPVTTNCIQENGSGVAQNVPVGMLLIRVGGSTWSEKSFNHNHTAGGSSVTLPVTPSPWLLDARLTGLGNRVFNVEVRVTKRWANPIPLDLPVIATAKVTKTNSRTTNDQTANVLSKLGPVTVPAAMTDSGWVVLGTLAVPQDEIFGSRWCVTTSLALASNPNTSLTTRSAGCLQVSVP